MQTYLVGGAVRDQLLNYPYQDKDWVVVGATPDELIALGYQQVGKDFPVFLHPETKEEYALARRERKQGSGYHGFVCDFGPEISLEEDLSRRDLRINAMAMDSEGTIIDPYGGQQDIADRLLRHIAPAFREDPLRVIRVARYAARYAHLGFRVAEDTLALMTEMSDSGELRALSPERLWTEFSRALGERSPAVFFKVLLDCRAIASLHPAWAEALTDRILKAVSRAATLQLATPVRFAISAAALDTQQANQLCQTLRCSASAQRLATLFAAHIPLPALDNPENILTLIEQFDYLRRPELLKDFCDGVRAISGSHDAILQLIEKAARSAAEVNAAELMAEGYNGKALGTALRQKRCDVIAKLMKPN